MKKILIIETSPTITGVADSLLRQNGYDVTCFNDGLAAYNFARNERPDLIISGLGLPNLNGVELCKKINSDPLTGGIPVILMVGDHDKTFMDQLDVSGARARLKKPFSPKELLSAVEKYAGAGTSMHITRIVDQNAEGAPRLAPESESSEPSIGFPHVARPQEQKTGAPFNLDWEDIKLPSPSDKEKTASIDFDDTGLVIDEDQYGLTNLNITNFQEKSKRSQEDYNWFVDEMRRDLDTKVEGQKPDNSAAANPTIQKTRPAADISFQDIGKPVTQDESKYHQFLEQFKKDTNVLADRRSSELSATDIDWLVNAIAEKLAQRIIEKIDKNELRQIVASVLSAKMK